MNTGSSEIKNSMREITNVSVTVLDDINQIVSCTDQIKTAITDITKLSVRNNENATTLNKEINKFKTDS